MWTTLQVCASGSYDSSGHFVLPTFAQERYMLYDAILNGARSIAFYGGNNPNCWTATRQPVRLELELLELGAEAASGRDQLAEPTGAGARESGHDPDVAGERCDDPGDQPQGNSGDLWVIAARRGAGHGTRDDRRASRGGLHRDGLHRGAVDHRLERLVHGRLRPVGRPRLPLRSGCASAATTAASATSPPSSGGGGGPTSSRPGPRPPGGSRSATVST